MQIDHLGTMILDSCERNGESVAMRSRHGDVWREIRYTELAIMIRTLASALRDDGIVAGDRMAIFSLNRPEWAIADFAAQVLRCLSVPVYATNTPAQLRYILEDAEVSCCLWVARTS